jgi:hypothetical protein
MANSNKDDNEDMTEEEILKASEAYMTFVLRFGEYVREMNPELWAKAREYAADFTQIPGVSVELVDNDESENDEDYRNKSGAD